MDAAVRATCRFCGSPLSIDFLDLGEMALANRFVAEAELAEEEPTYRLHVKVCESCLLVQHDAELDPADIFSDYAYFSSYSRQWVEHARRYAHAIRGRVPLTERSKVVEIASNDGYLLRHFVEMGIPVLGVDPARNVAATAIAAGIPTEVAFFGRDTAARLAGRGDLADLVVANNVLAHAPDVNDMIAGVASLLKPGGMFTAEFPHLLRLIAEVQFDTIYHEHFFYYSLHTFEKILASHGLRVFDVDELPTHGGSLRIYACRTDAPHAEREGLSRVRGAEARRGITRAETYAGFAERVERARSALVGFLRNARAGPKRVVGFGAAAKGNTLLNYCGVDRSMVEYVADETPAKIGKYLPGNHIPVVDPDQIRRTRPDYLLILPWNHKREIMAKLDYVKGWGGRFVVPVPATEIME